MAAPFRLNPFSVPPHERVRIWLLWMGMMLGGLVSLLLVIIFGGESTRMVRDKLGISRYISEPQGVYANCNNLRNNRNRFCQHDYEGQTRRVPMPPKSFGRVAERPSVW